MSKFNALGHLLVDCIIVAADGRELGGDCATMEEAQSALREIHQKYDDAGLSPRVHCDARIKLL